MPSTLQPPHNHTTTTTTTTPLYHHHHHYFTIHITTPPSPPPSSLLYITTTTTTTTSPFISPHYKHTQHTWLLRKILTPICITFFKIYLLSACIFLLYIMWTQEHCRNIYIRASRYIFTCTVSVHSPVYVTSYICI